VVPTIPNNGNVYETEFNYLSLKARQKYLNKARTYCEYLRLRTLICKPTEQQHIHWDPKYLSKQLWPGAVAVSCSCVLDPFPGFIYFQASDPAGAHFAFYSTSPLKTPLLFFFIHFH
jgi:hypothetical protein